MQALFAAVFIVVVSIFFLISGFLYIYVMLTLTTCSLVNIVFSMTYTLNGQNFPSKIFITLQINAI